MKKLLRSLPARARRRSVLLGALVVLVVVGAATGGWLLTREDEAATAAPTTATVTTQTVEETVAASGTVAAAASADLDFEVSGTVTEVRVEPGDRVRKGQLLAVLDDTTLRAQRDAAASSLDAAVAQLDEAQDADSSEVQVAAAEASVSSARATLAAARDAVAAAELRASIAGTVAAVGLEIGDTVGSGSSTGSGTGSGTGASTGVSSGTATGTGTETSSEVAFSLVSRNRFVIDATVGSTDVDRVSDGLQAEITVTGVTGTVYGTVADVGAVAEVSSAGGAVFPVTIQVTGTRRDLYAGVSAEASIVVQQRTDVLTVDSRAVRSDDDGTYVDLVVEGGTERTAVEVGETYGMATEVVSGLRSGDQVQIPGFSGVGERSEDGGGGGFPGELPERGLPEGGFPEGGFPGGAPQ